MLEYYMYDRLVTRCLCRLESLQTNDFMQFVLRSQNFKEGGTYIVPHLLRRGGYNCCLNCLIKAPSGILLQAKCTEDLFCLANKIYANRQTNNKKRNNNRSQRKKMTLGPTCSITSYCIKYKYKTNAI